MSSSSPPSPSQSSMSSASASSNHGVSSQRKRTFPVHEEESLSAIDALIRRESKPIYQVGRAYLRNLFCLRDRLAAKAKDRASREVSRKETEKNDAATPGRAVGAESSRRRMSEPSSMAMAMDIDAAPQPLATTPKDTTVDTEREKPPESHSVEGSNERILVEQEQQPPTSKPDGNASGVDHCGRKPGLSRSKPYYDDYDPIRPNENPNMLIEWRARIVEWLFSFGDSIKFERNTVIKAIAYLDIFSMRICFPSQFKALCSGSADSSGPPSKKARNGHDSPSPSVDSSKTDPFGGLCRHQYILAAAASIHIAAKVYQSHPQVLSSQQLACLVSTDQYSGQYSAHQIECAEKVILDDLLGFSLHPPTSSTFVMELIPMLLPNQKKDISNGRFGACTWKPETEADDYISTAATFFCELVSYTHYFPFLSGVSPSKIALAAVIEAAGNHYHSSRDSKGQEAFQTRVHDLAEIARANQRWESLEVFEYSREISLIQSWLSKLLRLNGIDESVVKYQAEKSKKDENAQEEKAKKNPSPNTAVANVASSDAKMPSKQSAFTSLFHNHTKNSSTRTHKKTRSPGSRKIVDKTAIMVRPPKFRSCTDHRVWEQTDYSSKTSNRRFQRQEIQQLLPKMETV